MITTKKFVSLMMAMLTLSALSATKVDAVERRSAQQIPLEELIKETYRFDIASDSLGIAWWISWDYWKTAFLQDKQISPTEIQSFESELRPVFMLAVVQADVSSEGNFDFFSEATIQRGLKVTYINRDGKAIILKPLKKISPNLSLLQQSVRPMLSKAMGNFGQNFWLFVYSDVDSSGNRIISPDEPGELRLTLVDKSGARRSELVVEFPLNSLFVPRLCPNGKPAHISWKYCPWDGTNLKN
jgi:hypothetical protein